MTLKSPSQMDGFGFPVLLDTAVPRSRFELCQFTRFESSSALPGPWFTVISLDLISIAEWLSAKKFLLDHSIDVLTTTRKLQKVESYAYKKLSPELS